ncbi:MAG TPA: hypothetical protein VNO70_15670, partial [Blastocatellia bacterium]|nr:hypothetical protein [Blastocatellia bacterium]
MDNFQRIQFQVFPSPETNDFEVRFFVNGEDFLGQHWPEMMGMDPDEILFFAALAPRDMPHTAMIARCSCG